MRHLILYENYKGIGREKRKIDLSKMDWAFHWITDANLFSQSYDTTGIDDTNYILRTKSGKKISMPPLPPERFILGDKYDLSRVCMTVDPGYYSAGTTGENNICLLFPIKPLLKLDYIDLTDNGEAEIRFKYVPDWDKLVHTIFVTNKTWSKGDGWEGFYYRPISEWFPNSLKDIVRFFPSSKSISQELCKITGKEMI